MLGGRLKINHLEKSDIPLPDRELLEYKESITLKLEKIHKQGMAISVIKAGSSGKSYQREIVMSGKKDGIPRELARIKIATENLNEVACREVLQAEKPFGKILASHGILTERRFKSFFKVPQNKYIANYAKSDKDFFYGRSYLIFLADSKKLLAEVTEIFL